MLSFGLSLELQKMNVEKNVVFGFDLGRIAESFFNDPFSTMLFVLTRFRLTQIVCKTLWKIIWDSKQGLFLLLMANPRFDSFDVNLN